MAIDLTEIQARHWRNDWFCAECEQDWPCEATRLCAEVERLRAVLEKIASTAHEAL